MSSITSVRLEDNIKEKLNFFAKKEKRSKNWIINQALEVFFITSDREKNTLKTRDFSKYQDKLDFKIDESYKLTEEELGV